MNNFYVYLYSDITTGVVFYVGKGKGGRYLIECHLGQNRFLDNKINKIGIDNIMISFTQSDLLEVIAFETEKCFIAFYGRRDLGTGTLCNLTDGGDGPSGVSEETRRKLRDAGIGRKPTDETRKKLSLSKLGNTNSSGRCLSKEHKRKISISLIGRVLPTGVRENMRKAHTGSRLSLAHRRAMSLALRGRIHSEETRRKMSIAQKRRQVYIL